MGLHNIPTSTIATSIFFSRSKTCVWNADVSANSHVLLLQAVNIDVDCAGDGITIEDGNFFVFYSSATIT